MALILELRQKYICQNSNGNDNETYIAYRENLTITHTVPSKPFLFISLWNENRMFLKKYLLLGQLYHTWCWNRASTGAAIPYLVSKQGPHWSSSTISGAGTGSPLGQLNHIWCWNRVSTGVAIPYPVLEQGLHWSSYTISDVGTRPPLAQLCHT